MNGNYPAGVHDSDFNDDPDGLDEEEEEPHRVPCCFCGQLTTIDPVYQDLCYRCCRADNE